MFSGLDGTITDGTEHIGAEISCEIWQVIANGALQSPKDATDQWLEEMKFMQTDESGNHMQRLEANIIDLTPGNSYTFVFKFKKHSSATEVRLSYGSGYSPTVIRAETVLSSTNVFTS